MQAEVAPDLLRVAQLGSNGSDPQRPGWRWRPRAASLAKAPATNVDEARGGGTEMPGARIDRQKASNISQKAVQEGRCGSGCGRGQGDGGKESSSRNDWGAVTEETSAVEGEKGDDTNIRANSSNATRG